MKHFFDFTVSEEEENIGGAKQFRSQWWEMETMSTVAVARFLLCAIISKGPQAYGTLLLVF